MRTVTNRIQGRLKKAALDRKRRCQGESTVAAAVTPGTAATGQSDGSSAAPKRHAGGRPRSLDMLTTFVLFLVTFRRFKKDMAHVGNLFGVSEPTVLRIYGRWSAAVGTFFKLTQGWGTAELAACMATGAELEKLDLEPGTAVYYADCTERFCEDTKDKAMHRAIYSEYKSHCTCKHLTISIPSTYLCWVSGAYCGSCTDDDIFRLDTIADMLPRFVEDPVAPGRVCFVYDRGITDRNYFHKCGVITRVPDSKRRGQKVFTHESAGLGKDIATCRIHIERLNKSLREYRAFTGLTHISQADLAGHEAQVARGLVNWKMELHTLVFDSVPLDRVPVCV